MRHLVLLLAFILTLIVSCIDNQYFDKQVEQNADRIIKLLDKSNIDTFKHWGYGTRGGAEIWSKLDTPTYGCFYFNKDTLKLSVGLIENFKRDFPFSLNIGTGRVHQISFKKITDEDINVSAWTNFGDDTIIVDKIELKDLFKEKDPFQTFAKLSKFKDSLQLVGTFYRPDIGNFIQFYLTNQHVLTYLPDTLEINPKFKEIWMGYFSTGKTINRNWNLRKLERPLDSG
ncbi:hypothetical protein GCM10027051_24720 [Niabella terrae]